MKELDYYYSSLYQQSTSIEFFRYFLLLSTILCLSYSIFAHGYYLYAAAITAVIFQISSWFLKTKVENIRSIANEFQKISILTKAYGKVPSEFQLSHLKAQVNARVSKKVEIKIKENKKGSEYNLKKKDTSTDILTSMIHENSYWNHHLYKIIFIFIITFISSIFVILLVTALFAIPLIKSDPDYSIPRLAFTFLSFSLVYEVLENAIKSYKSSRAMLEIDNELSREAKTTDEKLLKLFNQYCEFKEKAPNVPSFIYNANRQRLNSGWNSRMETIHIKSKA